MLEPRDPFLGQLPPASVPPALHPTLFRYHVGCPGGCLRGQGFRRTRRRGTRATPANLQISENLTSPVAPRPPGSNPDCSAQGQSGEGPTILSSIWRSL